MLMCNMACQCAYMKAISVCTFERLNVHTKCQYVHNYNKKVNNTLYISMNCQFELIWRQYELRGTSFYYTILSPTT